MKTLATFILFVIVTASGFCQGTYYEEYLIPDGYVGWVRVMHGVQDAPPLLVEDGRTIYKFDESGLLKTQTPLLAGSSYAKYYYYTDTSKSLLPDMAEGKGGMIHGGVVANTKALIFFVGTDHQYSLWYQSECSKQKDNYGYVPQNTKKCLEEFEKSKETSERKLDVAPEIPVRKPTENKTQ